MLAEPSESARTNVQHDVRCDSRIKSPTPVGYAYAKTNAKNGQKSTWAHVDKRMLESEKNRRDGKAPANAVRDVK